MLELSSWIAIGKDVKLRGVGFSPLPKVVLMYLRSNILYVYTYTRQMCLPFVGIVCHIAFE